MARVPLQQTPEVGLQIGSAPQFTGGRIEPVEDTVTDDIQRFSKTQRNVADIAIKLQEEYNDAEALKLSNEFESEVEEEEQKYLMTQGVNAVATVDKDTGTTVYDDAINNINIKLAEYGNKAPNSQIKYLFENMAAVKIRNATRRMTTHSLTEQRNYLEAETTAAISNHKKATIQNYQTWQDPEGAFKINYLAGLQRINELATLEGWEINPESGPISSQYQKKIDEYNMAIFKGVIKNFDRDKNYKELEAFEKALKDLVRNPAEVAQLKTIIDEKHNNHLAEKISTNVIENKTDQNDGQFLSQVNKLMTLDSNNIITNDNGGFVEDGFNSNDDLIDITNNKISEKIELLEKIKNTSKFYDPETKNTLIPQHQTTHLFAVQKLGVKKADNLYTRAYNNIKFDKNKYKNDINYKIKIDEKILDKYNELIIANVRRQYFLFDGTYADSVNNDLQVIKKGVNYNLELQNIVNDLDFVTNLRPLDVLKEELKNTIINPKKLEYAIEDLEFKYNKIKTEREEIYNEAFVDAKKIAFAEESGWKNLEANGIDINNFKKEDQQILKNGHPEESDVDTVIDLERNPKEVRDNIESYSHLLSQGQYDELVNYAAELRGEDKYIEATGNAEMFDTSLIRFGYTDIVEKVTTDKNAKDQYNFKFDYKQIKTEWINRIDAEQINKGRKLTRAEKQKILDEILADGVITKSYGLFKNKFITIPSVALEPDQFKDAFVFVDGKKIFAKRIPDEVREYFIKGYVAAGIPYTEQMIANEWVLHGKKKSEKEIIKFKEENNL